MNDLNGLNRYAVTICLVISIISIFYGTTSLLSSQLPENNYPSITEIVDAYRIEKFTTGDNENSSEFYELALYTKKTQRFYIRKPGKDKLLKYIGNIKKGDTVTVFFENKDTGKKIIKSLYKSTTPVINYSDTVAELKAKGSTLLKAGVSFLLITMLLILIRKKVPSGSILLTLSAIVLFIVAITNILKFNAAGNVNFEEYLKMVVLILFGLISIYGSIKLFNPNFEMLDAIFKLSPRKKYKVSQNIGLLTGLSFFIYFICSAITGVLTGEIYYYFSNSDSGWVLYKNNQILYLVGLCQSLFGIITFAFVLTWQLRAIKNDTSNK